MSHKIFPVTVVTGFLGSGKTTLINRILNENHGKKIAVILNEIGDINLDSELVVQSIGEELKIMNNGCVCCTVRGDLTKICLELLEKKISFDHLLIETTGMADPSPVAQTFFMDEKLRQSFYLDSVITVVDAVHIEQNLSEIKETQDQIGFADIILLNKIDCITDEKIKEVEAKIKTINNLAKIFKTKNSNVPIDEILGINAFDLNARSEIDPTITKEYHKHLHDNAIQSIYLEEDKPLDLERFNRFMQLLMSELGNQILRYKGILYIKGESKRIVFQGVHTMMGNQEDRLWDATDLPKTRIVFIGRHIPKDVLEEGLSLCIAK